MQSFFLSPQLWQGSGTFVLCPFVHVLTAFLCWPNPSFWNSLAMALSAACTCERGAPRRPGRWPERASQREQSPPGSRPTAQLPTETLKPPGFSQTQQSRAGPRRCRARARGTFGSAGWQVTSHLLCTCGLGELEVRGVCVKEGDGGPCHSIASPGLACRAAGRRRACRVGRACDPLRAECPHST